MRYQGKKLITLTSLWVLCSSAGAMAVNLISDGGFEDPVICPTPSVDFFSGSFLGPWAVGGVSPAGGVDLVCSTEWLPDEGDQSVDLNADDPGSLSQDISTIPGRLYRLTFSLAGNPNGPPAIKTLDVNAGPWPVQSFSFDTTGKTPGNMGWVTKGFFFVASSFSTSITFTSTTVDPDPDRSAFGPAIDNVVVEQRCVPDTMLNFNALNLDLNDPRLSSNCKE